MFSLRRPRLEQNSLRMNICFLFPAKFSLSLWFSSFARCTTCARKYEQIARLDSVAILITWCADII